jgi:ribonuclease D
MGIVLQFTIKQNFIDLQLFVDKFGIEDNSLQKIYAIIFGKKISKSQRLSNWEAAELTPAQQSYAAIDAWACLKIYNYLTQSKKNNNRKKQ